LGISQFYVQIFIIPKNSMHLIFYPEPKTRDGQSLPVDQQLLSVRKYNEPAKKSKVKLPHYHHASTKGERT
jgi:hypothetical protein